MPFTAGQKLRASELNDYVAPVKPTLNSPWTHYTDSIAVWDGLQYWRRGGVVTIAGAIGCTSAVGVRAVVLTLPVGFRPAAQVEGVNGFNILADGRVWTTAARAAGAISSTGVTFAAVP